MLKILWNVIRSFAGIYMIVLFAIVVCANWLFSVPADICIAAIILGIVVLWILLKMLAVKKD